MRTVRNLAVVGLMTFAAPLAGQGATQPPPRWADPKCDLKPGHQLVNRGVNSLKSASNARAEDQRQKELANADTALREALTSGGQDKNPAAWYYLGRYYVLRGDAPGIDSSFTRAESLKPECKEDIGLWRRVVWVPAFNAGVAAWQANNLDSAINAFRRANTLLPNEPTGFKYIATLFYNTSKPDSSVIYFRRAADAAAQDPKFAQDRKDALYNLGRIEQSQQHWPEAEAAYREYLGVYPNDPEVLASLGGVYMQRGNRDSAFAIYRQIISRADSMGYYPLLRAGVEISMGVPSEPDTAAAGRDCRSAARSTRPVLTAARIRARCDSVTSNLVKAYDASSQEAFKLAAQALDASLKLNPHYRETLIHRANTALGQRDAATALEYSRRLLTIDPMNKQSIQIMAFAQRANGKIDSTLHYFRLHDSTLVADVTISQFDSTDGGRDLKGLVTNARSTATPPINLVFEFVNVTGAVVTADTVKLAPIQPEQSQVFELHPKGAGIAAWRYRKQ